MDGFFCLVDQHSYAPRTTSAKSVRAFTGTPTTRVGLATAKSIVDIGADSSLGDTANGSANYAAPGAQRLKFALTLTEKAYTAATSTITNVSSSDFIELVRIVSGEIRQRIRYPVYSDIEDTLARRTYDESGNYTVRPFRASVTESKRRRTLTIPALSEGAAFTENEYISASTGSSSSSSGGAVASGYVVDWDSTNDLLVVDLDSSSEFVAGDYVYGVDSATAGYVTASTTEHIDVGLEPGKAYVFGREFETISTEHVSLKKAREISSTQTASVNCAYGNYFICDTINGLFDINEQETVYLYAADSYSSSSSSGATGDIGTAKIKHVLYDTTNGYYEVYVYGVTINSGESLSSVERIVSSSTTANRNN